MPALSCRLIILYFTYPVSFVHLDTQSPSPTFSSGPVPTKSPSILITPTYTLSSNYLKLSVRLQKINLLMPEDIAIVSSKFGFD